MIVEKETWTVLMADNISHYEKLGYEIPRQKDKRGRITISRGTKIKVKVEHLPKGSQIKLHTICDYCGGKCGDKPKTYEYILRLRKEVDKDCCKNCSGIKQSELHRIRPLPLGKSLAENYPQLIEEWNTSKNNVTPWNVYSGSHVKVWWVCEKGHEWDASVNSRTNGTGCPYCSGQKVDISNCLATTHPYLILEWHPTKNDDLTPYDVTSGSSKEVWWICSKRHEWKTSTYHRTIGDGCAKCRYETNTGENHPMWKGGITPLNSFLRGTLTDWKRASMKNCKYKCVITDERKWSVIHHLYSFNKILQEIFEETGIPIKEKIKDYTNNELEILKSKCIEIHNKHPLGVCLKEEIHNLYHFLYGDDNTPEQFAEFKTRYKLGEFS